MRDLLVIACTIAVIYGLTVLVDLIQDHRSDAAIDWTENFDDFREKMKK